MSYEAEVWHRRRKALAADRQNMPSEEYDRRAAEIDGLPLARPDLSFAELRQANVRRCNATYHAEHGINEWTPTDWACAMAGEAGEACNEVKKLRRIAPTPEALGDFREDERRSDWAEAVSAYAGRVENVANELADVLIYADLLAARLGIDLGEAVRRKFNAVSDRVGSNVKLQPVTA